MVARIERRIAGITIQPPSRAFHWSALTCLITFALGLTLWCTLGPNPSLPQNNEHASQSTDNIGLEIGDARLVEHLAAMMNDRSVLVIWSCQGNGISAESPDFVEHRAGKYRFRRLSQTQLANGRTLICSLFTPDPDVHPTFDPPAISVSSSDGSTIRFSASPTLASDIQLADAVRAAGFGGSETKKILHEVQTRND